MILCGIASSKGITKGQKVDVKYKDVEILIQVREGYSRSHTNYIYTAGWASPRRTPTQVSEYTIHPPHLRCAFCQMSCQLLIPHRISYLLQPRKRSIPNLFPSYLLIRYPSKCLKVAYSFLFLFLN